nr:immunoglobulin light chain junction region [Macaca mulatta]MOW73316.1 immunoglobulin light chain junction region [Macaca mulatta]MOW73861.1 immunoglobulin light chain junction region [Macaca mulatta]
CQQYYSYPYNF